MYYSWNITRLIGRIYTRACGHLSKPTDSLYQINNKHNMFIIMTRAIVRVCVCTCVCVCACVVAKPLS